MRVELSPCPDTDEDAIACDRCDALHWPSDEDAHNSTWQQWQCLECGSWNDRENP